MILNLASLIAGWVLASQVWAATTVVESGSRLTISGLDAYPQITFLLLTGLLILWLSRYLNSLFSKFLTTAVVVLLLATASPIWFESASGSLNILMPQISKATGVSDWLGQSELIRGSSYGHTAADGFVVTLIVWFISLTVLLWTNRVGESKKEFVTRIDKLPSW